MTQEVQTGLNVRKRTDGGSDEGNASIASVKRESGSGSTTMDLHLQLAKAGELNMRAVWDVWPCGRSFEMRRKG